MEEVTSELTLFWHRLVKWQAMIIAIILAVFFVSLYFIGNMNFAEEVDLSAGAAIISALIVIFIVLPFDELRMPGTIASCAAITARLLSDYPLGLIGIVFFVMLTILFAADNAGEMQKEYGFSKQYVWFSYIGEFVLVLLIMSL